MLGVAPVGALAEEGAGPPIRAASSSVTRRIGIVPVGQAGSAVAAEPAA
jgi:hypothetical protein